MWLLRFFEKLKRFIVFIFPFFLLLGVLSIVLGESYTSFIFSKIIPLLVVLNILQLSFLLVKRKRKAIYNFGVLLLFYLCFDSFYQLNFNEKEKISDVISILTYNVQGYKSRVRSSKNTKTRIADFIEQSNADIICIQEFSAIEYKSYVSEYPYWVKSNIDVPYKSVLGIFSKFPIIKKGYLELPNSINNAMFVDINVNDRPVRLYNIHLESYKLDSKHQLRNLNSYRFVIPTVFQTEIIRIAQAKLVREHINSFDGDVIVVGDFNSTQYSPVYRILKDTKKDTFVEAGNGFGSTFELFNYPFKLDHILVDESFEVINHQNFDINLSDHEPVLAEIKFKD